MVQGVVSERKWSWRIMMDTLPVTRVWFVFAFAIVASLAGCSDEPDERKQAVYRTEPGRAVQPVPGYGQQYQYPYPSRPRPRYPAQSPYQPPPAPAQRPAPRFERDPSNPWAYQPSQQYTPPPSQPTPAQPWSQPGGDTYRPTERGGSTGHRFGGYRPLDSDKPKRETRDQADARQGVPYPYYPAPYPYGGGVPYTVYPPVGVPPDW